MTRGVRKYFVSSIGLVALIAIAGCSHYLLAEREPWRHDAEVACLSSGVVEKMPGRVRVSAISGPGACGADYPLKVSALGESGPLGYDDEPIRPPGAIPDGAVPQRWPLAPSNALPPQPYTPPPQPYTPAPPPNYAARPAQTYLPPPQTYSPPPPVLPQYGRPQYAGGEPGAPISLSPPGLEPADDDDDVDLSADPRGAPPASTPNPYGSFYRSPAPLGAPRGPVITGSAGPVEVKPPATLACPIVSMLDEWIGTAVQPAAQKWFRQPVVEIKQISAYSCRGMNGDPSAHISEHAFGNALDIAEFTLADGHKISVQYGWHGSPEEQGFLHDVQAAACQDFTTVLAPGANVYHYNHIHVDLMRRYGDRHICEPAAMPGDVAAERARARYAAHSDTGVTGSLSGRTRHNILGYSSEAADHLPLAIPGDD